MAFRFLGKIMTSTNKKGFATKAIHAGQNPEQSRYRPLIAPIVTSSVFQEEAPGQYEVRQSSSILLKIIINNIY